MPSLSILAGPDGLSPGAELTFFYPSTEWSMAQAFNCFCGASSCHGRISGAKDMMAKQLEGLWLNGHIRDMLEERDAARLCRGIVDGRGPAVNGSHEGMQCGWEMNRELHDARLVSANGAGHDQVGNAAGRAGPTSRELSGEMGGDTASA